MGPCWPLPWAGDGALGRVATPAPFAGVQLRAGGRAGSAAPGGPGSAWGQWTPGASSALTGLPQPLLCFPEGLAKAKSLYRLHMVPGFQP